MKTSYLLHHLIFFSAQKDPHSRALTYENITLNYKDLAQNCWQFAQALEGHHILEQERVAVFLEKRFEFVISCFGASCAANIFVPINPILKADQVKHILLDSGAKVLITSAHRLDVINEIEFQYLDLEIIVAVDLKTHDQTPAAGYKLKNRFNKEIKLIDWHDFLNSSKKEISFANNPEISLRPMVDRDAVSILYTSGSTGQPKGVVLSHSNMVFGAKSVASYLENSATDSLLAVLPLSFDAGFSQLTTAFHCGARAVLLNYFMPKDILDHVIKEKITGITAVPPLWMQIANLKWPSTVSDHLRYFANTGGRMPLELLKKLRENFKKSKPYLMYGLTESFRSTYLPPEQIDSRPESIGKAIPNAEILVLRSDGTPCDADEPGELVHRGALVGLGYWNDPKKTAERYKVIPSSTHCRSKEIILPEIGVFSGDTVKMDRDGYLYFIGRRDEMIKTSGYRVSPTEVEEVIYNSELVSEAVVFGVPHPSLGQGIIASVMIKESINEPVEIISNKILTFCQIKMPPHLVPEHIVIRNQPHPRNQNGKLDRKKVSFDFLSERPESWRKK